jgi:RecA-family ATPase
MTTVDEATMTGADLAPAMGNGQAKPPPTPLRIIRPIDWQGKPVPERKWIVPGWIPAGYVTAGYGDGGTGKTTLQQQLLTARAIGQPWLGLPVTPGRSIGVFCEDRKDDIHITQAAINRYYGCDFADLKNVEFIDRVGEDNIMMSSTGEITRFFEQILAWAKAFKADFASIDTATDTFGGNENIRTEVRQYIQACLGRLARAIDGTVVFTAHPSRTGMVDGTGGNTAWSNTVRSRWWLRRPDAQADEAPDGDLRIFSRAKANYARIGDEIRLRWRDGVFVPDRTIDTLTPGLMGELERDRCQIVFLDLLRKVIAEGRYASPSRQSEWFAPALFAKRSERQGFTKKDFSFAMERLFEAGRIRLGEHKTQRRKTRECILPEGGM